MSKKNKTKAQPEAFPEAGAPDFIFLGKKSSHELADSEVLIVAFPLEDFSHTKKILPMLKSARKDWSSEIETQLEEKIDELLENTEDGKSLKSARSLTLQFSEGGCGVFLLLPQNITSSALHGFLRAELQPLIKRTREEIIRVDLSRISTDLETKSLEAIATLISLNEWKAPQYGLRAKKLPKTKQKTYEWILSLNENRFREVLGPSLILGEAMNTTRTLANLPGNELTPEKYTHWIQERVASLPHCHFDFMGVKKLESIRAGAFLAVAQGSPNADAGIVHLTYAPPPSKKSSGGKSAKKPKKICLVGKGICFDTGGVNLKPHSSMLHMNKDMTGSAIAFSLFEALVLTEAPFEVHAFLALAENHISNTAFKPNDVVYASDGTSIEINHTDAEGRMVLADTLVLARKVKADLTLDFATLTGSAVRSIGTQRSAVFSNRVEYLAKAQVIGDECGERVWGFPIGDEYAEKLKSDVADILQCTEGSADHILAATFLSRFIGDECPWIHIDLSADSNKGGLGLVETETTAFGVRLGFALVNGIF